MMFSILIITHGLLSQELKSSVEFVLGEKIIRKIFAMSIDEDTRDYDTYSNKIANYLMENSNTIIFTDMFGGTPSNIGLAYFNKDSVEIISGVNLPMLIKAATIDNCDSFKEAVKIIRQSGQDNIIVAGDLEI